MRYFIVDDDRASRVMLSNIINDSELGSVIGEAKNGVDAIPQIIMMQPEFVLIDLLMPNLDGIETIEHLRQNGFEGSFIMISQVVNKEMVAESYSKGIEFFIHKPINYVEVQMVLRRTAEQHRLKNSLQAIRQSLTNFEIPEVKHTKKTTREHIQSILNDMGIVAEIGSEDIIKIIEQLLIERHKIAPLPPLKEIYEKVAMLTKNTPDDILKESKAIEQRVRRTILAAMINLANLGIV